MSLRFFEVLILSVYIDLETATSVGLIRVCIMSVMLHLDFRVMFSCKRGVCRDLSFNRGLRGQIPTELGSLTSLQYL